MAAGNPVDLTKIDGGLEKQGWNPSYLIGGGVQTLVGLFLLYHSTDYDFGTSKQMGPGYFPGVLSAMFVILGLVTILLGRTAPVGADQVRLRTINWRPAVMILGSIALFMFLLENLGFVVTVFLTTALTRFADRSVGWRGTLLVAAINTAINVTIFVVILQMPFKLWW